MESSCTKAQRMEKRLVPGLFILFHFFEKLRNAMIAAYPNPFDVKMMERTIIESYESDVLVEAHQVYQVLHTAFNRKFRPPSYAGVFERTIRGWTKAPASDAQKLHLLIFGGLRDLKNVMRLPVYNDRLKALEAFNTDTVRNQPQISNRLPSIAHLSCSVMSQQHEQRLLIDSSSSPTSHERIWNDVALDIFIRKEVITPVTGIQDVYNFLSDLVMMEDRDQRSQDLDGPIMIPFRDEGDEDG